MGRKCVVRGCLAQNATLYSFPNICAEPVRYMAWVKFVKARRQDWSGPTSTRPVICSEHFTAKCFNSFNHKLTRTAVPTVYPWNWELDGDDPNSHSQQNAQFAQVVVGHCYGSRCANPACISKHKQLTETVSKLELQVLQLRRQLQLAQFSSKSVIDARHSKRICSQKQQTSETTTVKCNISTQTRPSSLHKGQIAVVNDTHNCDEAPNCRPSAADACSTITAGLVAVFPSLIGASAATISGITIGTASAPPSKRRRMLSQSDATLTHDAATQWDVLSVGTAAVDTQCLAQCCRNCAGTCVDKPIVKSVGVSCHMFTVPDSLTSSHSVGTPCSEVVSMQDTNLMCQPNKSEDSQHEGQRVAPHTLIRVDLEASVSSRPNCRSFVIVQRKQDIVLVPVQKNSVVQCNRKESPATTT